jgi:peptide/nickel transport system substrate-binding protein
MKQRILTTILVIFHLVGLNVTGQDLIYAERHFPEVFDPVYGGMTFEEERINYLIHSGLYGEDEDGQPQYNLAAAFPLYSERGQVLEIKLRSDVKWSDGKSVTIEDVIYSWRILTTKMGDELPFLYDIESIKAKPGSSNTLIIRLKQPNPEMDFHNYLIFPLLPQHVIGGYDYSKHDDYAASPVTVGRYQIDQISGNNLDFKAHFWPHEMQTSDRVQTIRIMQFRSTDQIFRFFASMSTNFILDIPVANLNDVLSQPENYGARDYAANMWAGIALNNKHKLLSHQEARIALTKLFDRESAINNRFQRKASLITGPFTNGSSFYDIDVIPYSFDEDEAKTILETIGCTWDTDGKINFEGEAVTLRFMKNKAATAGNMDVVLSDFSSRLEKMGFTVMENDISNEKIFIDKIKNKRDDYDLAFINIKYPQDLGVWDIFHSTGGYNTAQFEDAVTDNLMDQLLQASNDNVRIDLGKKIHQRIHEKSPFVFLWAYNYTVGYNVRRLDNIDIDPTTIFNSLTTWKAID